MSSPAAASVQALVPHCWAKALEFQGVQFQSLQRAVPVENASFGKVELFPPRHSLAVERGKVQAQIPPAQLCQNPVEGRKSRAGSQEKPPGSLRNYSTGIVLQVNVFN